MALSAILDLAPLVRAFTRFRVSVSKWDAFALFFFAIPSNFLRSVFFGCPRPPFFFAPSPFCPLLPPFFHPFPPFCPFGPRPFSAPKIFFLFRSSSSSSSSSSLSFLYPSSPSPRSEYFLLVWGLFRCLGDGLFRFIRLFFIVCNGIFFFGGMGCIFLF